MLVLCRKPGEKLIIGDQIMVTILAVRGNQVRLGIQAPDDIAVRRSELGQWSDRVPSSLESLAEAPTG